MITQRLIMTSGLWACAGCRVRFSHNEDGQVFLVHHGNCPEMAAIPRERVLRRVTEATAAERERIRTGVTAMRESARQRSAGGFGSIVLDEVLTAALDLING